jgi:hypothetical protein
MKIDGRGTGSLIETRMGYTLSFVPQERTRLSRLWCFLGECFKPVVLDHVRKCRHENVVSAMLSNNPRKASQDRPIQIVQVVLLNNNVCCLYLTGLLKKKEQAKKCIFGTKRAGLIV